MPDRASMVFAGNTQIKDWPLKQHAIALNAFALLTTQANADCDSVFDLFPLCDIKGRDTSVHVCHNDQDVTYSCGVFGEVP